LAKNTQASLRHTRVESKLILYLGSTLKSIPTRLTACQIRAIIILTKESTMKKNQDPIITQNETIQDLLELADQIWDAGSFDYMIDEWRQNPKASGYDEQMISWFLHLRGEIKQAKKKHSDTYRRFLAGRPNAKI